MIGLQDTQKRWLWEHLTQSWLEALINVRVYGDEEFSAEDALEHIAHLLRRPNFNIWVGDGEDSKLNFFRRKLDLHALDDLSVAAVERIGNAQNARQNPNDIF